ncbi:GNAT family N-acetyltransferase [Thermodesulfobacteriota bacterium]
MIQVRIVDHEEYFGQIRNVRDDVFCKEQGVPHELEFDGMDSGATHSIAFDDDIEIGTGRMLSDGHIGRIAVKKQYRGKGIGKMIMKSLIDEAVNMRFHEIWLSSQYRAKGFYEKLGFIETGSIYQEADIDHIKMKKKL